MPARDPVETGQVIQFPRGQEVEEREFDPLRRRGAGELNLLQLSRLLRRYVLPSFEYERVVVDPTGFTASASAFLGRHLRAKYSVALDAANLVLWVEAVDESGGFHYGLQLDPTWFATDGTTLRW